MTAVENTKIKGGLHWGLISRYRAEIMGFAILWVMLFHFYGRLPESLPGFLVNFIDRGNIGVDIFFVVSGIGLFFSWQKDRHIGSFYRKRFIRILIPYLMISVPLYIWKYLIYRYQPVRCIKSVTGIAFFESGASTTWYITAIAVFYLLFPLLYFWIYGKAEEGPDIRPGLPYAGDPGRRIDPATMTVILIGIWSFICMIIQQLAPAFFDNTEIMLARLPAFMIGCFLGSLVYTKRRLPNAAAAAGILFMAVYLVYLAGNIKVGVYWVRTLRITVAMALIFIIIWLFYRFFPKGSRILRFFGERSIELYLLHIAVRGIWKRLIAGGFLFGESGRLDYLCIILISIALAAALHPLINRISAALLKKNAGSKERA